MNSQILDKIATVAAKDPERYQRRSGDDAALARFYELFPMESLHSLTLEKYCLGHGSNSENFSWWLERGLQKAIGSYSPGSSKGHLIYRKKDGSYYTHRYFSELGPEKAMEVVSRTLYAIASCSSLDDARVINDDNALAKRAGLDRKKYVVCGEARALRILTMYHPEWMLPINSIAHLKHFLKELSGEANPELPEKSIALMIQLSALLEEIRIATEIPITPWGFSDLLYSEEIGIVPPKRDSIYKGNDTEDNGIMPSKRRTHERGPWWQRFFASEEQAHEAFDLFKDCCLVLGVTDSQGGSAERVSFTNVIEKNREWLRLNCANILTFQIGSIQEGLPGAWFVLRDEDRKEPFLPKGYFANAFNGHKTGFCHAEISDLLAPDSSARNMLFASLGDIAATFTGIKKRTFKDAHRQMLLNAAFDPKKRKYLFANGPHKKPYDREPGSIPSSTSADDRQESPKNRILYGPPGTGKTYSSIDRALEIIDPTIVESTKVEKDGRAKRKARFDELVQAKRIGFVTFHQSFSYEDFVEGLKASTDDSGQVKYEVEDGIFKQMCSAAAASSGGSRIGQSKKVDPADRAIWKMSLGNTLGPDASIYDECIENGYVLLGWGQDIDFTGASTRDDIKARVKERKSDGADSDYTVTACHAFVNTMKPGDLIIVSDGNHKFRAIGVVKGDYRFLPVDEDRELLYQQCRDVDWIRTYSPSLANDQLMTVAFSQATIYRLKPPAIDLDLVRSLLSENESSDTGTPRPFILIIDEINRGNISRIFGELITLIEESKRAGNPEALTVKLPYSKEMFSVPANLHLIGTMNTADRSLAQLDIALRRRFVFEELMPDPAILAELPTIDGIDVSRMLTAMNQRIEILYDREHTIGHTFFLSLFEQPTLAELQRIFTGSILPLLEEYFFEDWKKIRLVLADHQKPAAHAMIVPKYSDADLQALFGQDPRHAMNPVYQRNAAALAMPGAYIGIYDATKNVAQIDSNPLP